MSHTKLALYGALAAQVGAVGTALVPGVAPSAGTPPTLVAAGYTFTPSMDSTLVTVCFVSLIFDNYYK